MSDETAPQQRPGSGADLSRRVERLESQMSNVSMTVERVENNQKHAEELNKLRFDGLDRTITSLSTDLKGWMMRMEGVFTGDVQTAASRDLKAAKEQAEREGAVIMSEWTVWRKDTDTEMAALRSIADRAIYSATLLKFAMGGSLIGALGTVVSLYVALNRQ